MPASFALGEVVSSLQGGRTKAGGKSDNADRVLALDPGTIDPLRKWKAVQDSERDFGADYLNDDLVFTWEDGRRVHNLTRRFARNYARVPPLAFVKVPAR